jgi:hypothetical protein
MPSCRSTCDHRGRFNRCDESSYKVSSQTVASPVHPLSTAAQLYAGRFKETFSKYCRMLFLSALCALVRRFGIAVASSEPVFARLARAGHPKSAHVVEVMKQTDVRSRHAFSRRAQYWLPDAPDDFALEKLCVTANIESLRPHCLAAPFRHRTRPMPWRRGCNTTSQARNEKKIGVGVCTAYRNVSANF